MIIRNTIILLFYLFFDLSISISKDIYVGNNKEFINIKNAIESSVNGDRIIIDEGIYHTNGIIIDKEISIIGLNSTVIDAQNIGEAFTIKSSNVTIQGITIKNVPVGFVKDYAGIKIENSKKVTIKQCRFVNNFFAVYLSNSDSSYVISNVITGNAENESFSGNGIHLWKCNTIEIYNNYISGHRDGIYLEFAINSIITGNYSEKNLRYGLHFMFSEGNRYRKNVFCKNGAGVAVMYTKKVEMTENIFEENWGPSSYGLLLKDISKSYISDNIFSKNTTGIYSEGTTYTLIENNIFYSNGWALKILGNCNYDTVINNDFLSNTFDISTNSNLNDNYYDSNYWDRYNGYDLDRNLIGDVPYRPTSLFSTLVVKSPEAILLIRSFLVELFDLTEKIIPSVIPESLTDNHPSMIIKNRKEFLQYD